MFIKYLFQFCTVCIVNNMYLAFCRAENRLNLQCNTKQLQLGCSSGFTRRMTLLHLVVLLFVLNHVCMFCGACLLQHQNLQKCWHITRALYSTKSNQSVACWCRYLSALLLRTRGITGYTDWCTTNDCTSMCTRYIIPSRHHLAWSLNLPIQWKQLVSIIIYNLILITRFMSLLMSESYGQRCFMWTKWQVWVWVHYSGYHRLSIMQI